ncbi:hypothetical protein JD969_14940 [Planctomycetota bacterium]|nr:hypothetical protein JD969_14940 [Planctomycetota bacterium]
MPIYNVLIQDPKTDSTATHSFPAGSVEAAEAIAKDIYPDIDILSVTPVPNQIRTYPSINSNFLASNKFIRLIANLTIIAAFIWFIFSLIKLIMTLNQANSFAQSPAGNVFLQASGLTNLSTNYTFSEFQSFAWQVILALLIASVGCALHLFIRYIDSLKPNASTNK